jgi:outer membrane lipoprotein-sorting protein
MMGKNANVAGILFLLAFLILSSALHAEDNAPSGTELAQKVYDYYIGDNSVSKVHMQLVDKSGGTRERSLMSMTMEKDDLRRSFIRFLEPADIAGTGFLSIEQKDGSTEQYLYLPALDRTRRIVSAHKDRAFVNTDFTYEDMQRRRVEDSEHQIEGEETVNDLECWILKTCPLPEADSQYSSLTIWVPKEFALPIKTHFFDQKGQHIKTYEVQELQEVQGIWTPMQEVMIDHQDGHKTLLIREKIEYNSSQVQESLFSTRYLESW